MENNFHIQSDDYQYDHRHYLSRLRHSHILVHKNACFQYKDILGKNRVVQDIHVYSISQPTFDHAITFAVIGNVTF